MQPIGRFFLIECDHRNGSYFAESVHLPRGCDITPQEGLAELQQHDDAIAIWECNPGESTIHDISEDMARMWFDQICADSSQDELPRFIQEHLPSEEIVDYYADQEHWADEARALESPYLTGRI